MADIRVMRDDLLPPRPDRAPAPDLDRRPVPRRRRAAARHRAQLRALARARDEEAADAARPAGRERLLRVVDAHVVELRARREAALGGHDVDQVLGLGRGQGRVPEGHGADARRLRPGRDRHPPPADRRAAPRRQGDRRARRERRRREAPAPDPGAARPLHAARGVRPARGPARRDRRRRPPLAGRALARSRRSTSSARGSTLVGAADAAPARGRGDGLRDLAPTSTRSAPPTSSTSCGCSGSGCSRARTTSRACASTPSAGASRRSGCAPARRSCTPGR